MDYMIKQNVLNLKEDIKEYMNSNEAMPEEQEDLREFYDAINKFCKKFDISYE